MLAFAQMNEHVRESQADVQVEKSGMVPCWNGPMDLLWLTAVCNEVNDVDAVNDSFCEPKNDSLES